MEWRKVHSFLHGRLCLELNMIAPIKLLEIPGKADLAFLSNALFELPSSISPKSAYSLNHITSPINYRYNYYDSYANPV